MRPPGDELPFDEKPIILLIVILVLIPTFYFGIRHYVKVREGAKREETYQSTLRSYRQAFKPGLKRKEVEESLRLKNIEFWQLEQDDLTKIGQDESLVWWCGKPDVLVQFRFTASTQRDRPFDADDGDALGDIEIIRRESGCI